MIFDRICKIVAVDHDNKQSGKAADDKAKWNIVSTKDANRPYKLTGEDLGLRLASARHARGLHLPTWIDSVLGSDYAHSPMTPRAHPSCQATHLSCQANHIHLRGHYDSSTSLGPESR
jgi:hypothetical protein